jgi:uncharacterized membrane protein AbrB (regulator of aidB expression)
MQGIRLIAVLLLLFLLSPLMLAHDGAHNDTEEEDHTPTGQAEMQPSELLILASIGLAFGAAGIYVLARRGGVP